MSERKIDKWILVQWSIGGRSVVNSRAVVGPAASDITIGAVVIITKDEGDQQTATIIRTSRDRKLLEEELSQTPFFKEDDDPDAGPSIKQDDLSDFSGSVSSWEPSDDHASTDDDDDEEEVQEQFRRSYSERRTRKEIKPCHRVEAINNIIKNRKRKHNETMKKHEKFVPDKKSLPDSTRKNYSSAPNTVNQQTVTVYARDIMNMKQCFQELFKILEEFKSPLDKNKHSNKFVKREVGADRTMEAGRDEQNQMDASDKSLGEESNRSDDNVLITNKYDNIAVKNTKILNSQDINPKAPAEQETEWVPIGSGKTLIHKDQYRKVNWKSYTIATRTLLLAVFPRRILATHSLTGKRSPAFQNKPAKMCLDPKIVTDVIIEITDRFRVKENLVRSIITTKCADECKMYKMRVDRRKTMPAKNKENLQADFNDDDMNNQTF